ncbi:MAG: pantoate--beta-alanine ligase [Candidatus Marinimicrobia bacterium]|nr:pantoate--beta-alanine ligase [Candidatus Neomarinimicrobiota bacterium]
MKNISTIKEFRKWRKNISGTIGFVPTMGALHEGHLSLVSKSNKTCEHTIVSIYINPTQFAKGEDLDTYPQMVRADLDKLSQFEADCVFLPDNSEMYPNEIITSNYNSDLFKILEGKSRPSFFKGVTTIVAKLFDIIEPTHAFFGEKDYQQFTIIKQMVSDLDIPIQIVPCPIIREENGLAMSSRNKYLTEYEFSVVATIFKALECGKNILKAGEIHADKLKREITQIINSESAFQIDYVSVSNRNTLKEIDGELEGEILVSIAVFLGKTRLIDNFTYSLSEEHI